MRSFAILTLALALGGCATVTRGTTSEVQVRSTPSDADVRTSYGMTCRTPCTLKVDRKEEFAVVISKQGFDPQTIDIKTRLAGAGAAGFAGNILIGGVIGMGVDAVTGATLEHHPNPVEVVLYPEGKTPPPPADSNIEPAPVAREPEAPPTS